MQKRQKPEVWQKFQILRTLFPVSASAHLLHIHHHAAGGRPGPFWLPPNPWALERSQSGVEEEASRLLYPPRSICHPSSSRSCGVRCSSCR